MKTKFTTFDILAMAAEVRERLVGMRVVQVYDIDHKTYLIKLQRPNQRAVLLIESGARFHPTEYEWPKHPAPSGFAMKLRKHLKNKRLESVRQLGVDRVVELQFGSDDLAHFLLLEMYDRGNLVLTDHRHCILNLLRPRTDNEDVRLAVREIYPVDACRQFSPRSEQQLTAAVEGGKGGQLIRKLLNPHLDFGSSLIDHVLAEVGFEPGVRLGTEFLLDRDIPRLIQAVRLGEEILLAKPDFTGIIVHKSDDTGGVYEEFHPMLYSHLSGRSLLQFVSFSAAVDQFFSQLAAQQLDSRVHQQEREAVKKLDNVRRDHQRRLAALRGTEREDRARAELLVRNAELVDRVSLVVSSALANQMSWRDVGVMVARAQKEGDQLARTIKALKLEKNMITLLLSDPYQEESDDEEEEGDRDGSEGEDKPRADDTEDEHIKPMLVDVDLSLSALANAGRFYDSKRSAAKKQQKTIDSSYKALKSAEQKTKKTLKEAAAVANIMKARKTHWFEKFLWFISSENFLVLGGRDQQQNELLVRRYLRTGDVYVHADLHGAASLIVKNPYPSNPVPPKTLHEAGTFAVSNSSAWDAKVITSAWWVNASQVSKTAPTGEYLTTGSFMIRGKKNYLPPCHLVLGFGVLFKLEDSSVARHLGERKVRLLEDLEQCTDGDSEAGISERLATVSVEDQSEPSHSNPLSSSSGIDNVSALGSGGKDGRSNLSEATKGSGDVVDESDEDSAGDTADDDVSDDSREDRSGGEGAGCSRSDETTSDGAVMEDQVKKRLDGDAVQHMRVSSTETGMKPEAETEPSELEAEREPTDHEAETEPTEQEAETEPTEQEAETEPTEQGAFPDTVVNLQSSYANKSKPSKSSENGGRVAFSSIQPFPPARKPGHKPSAKQSAPTNSDKEPGSAPKQGVRGKRSKMKRAQQKYRHQDEQERQIKMAVLQSAGKSKAELAREKKEEELQKQRERQRMHEERRQKRLQEAAEEAAADSEEDQEDQLASSCDGETLQQLTGQPLSEDELLYAIPVCAPYSTLLSYKFKAKLVPGPMKKGKAAKSILQVFCSDKSAVNREIDLLKSLKLEEIARNMPGKVKLGIAQSARGKKR